MKVKAKNLDKQQIIETLDSLYTAASAVKGRAEMKLFLRDLLTESERVMLGRRILIAQRLIGGETYEDIRGALGVGPCTIAKVERWLQDQMPGYETALKGMEKEFLKRRSKFSHYSRSQFEKKFPLLALLVKEFRGT